MIKTVILAEKANAAKDIAAALELENLKRLENGFYYGRKNGTEYILTYTQGHCARLKEPDEIDEKYRKWQLETLPIPFTENELVALDDKKKIVREIKKTLEKADIVINAGDAGREGELIQRWALKLAGYSGDVGRLWVSSLTKAAIKEAYENIVGYSDNEKKKLNSLYMAGEARAIMDKYLGFNYSRLLSLTKTDGVTVNFGRCKTPLTNAIIKRDEEIANFKKRTFYTVKIMLNDSLEAVLVEADGNRIEFDTLSEAESVLTSIKNKAKAENIEVVEKRINPPMPFDILNIQKLMSKKYDFEADKTLTLCQSLYDKHKILSYPRTDSRYLTSDLEKTLHQNLEVLSFGKFEPYVAIAKDRNIPKRYFNDKKVVDHHGLIPIVPDGKMSEIYEELSEDERKVFDEISLNFISLFLPECEFKTIKILFNVENKLFIANGKEITELGFKSLYQKDKSDDEEIDDMIIPFTVEEGQILDVTDKKAAKGETKPKSHFTTATLLDFMKLHNIGTGATRDKLIKELTEKRGQNKDRSVIKKGKYYLATDFGKKIDALIPDKLKTIAFLSTLDEALLSIEEGELTKDEFLEGIRTMFIGDLEEMKRNKKTLMKNEKKETTTGLSCPICGMDLRENTWGYGCTGWKKDGTGCNFSISNKMGGKKIPIRAIRELLTNGKTNKKVAGFTSKAGKSFDAYLKLVEEDGKMKLQYDFERK